MFALALFFHLLGAAIWVGGHLILVLVILPKVFASSDLETLLDFESRYERIGIPALLVQVVTGLWLSYHWLPDLSQWLSLDGFRSQTIVAKLVLLASTIALAAHARLRIIPDLTLEKLPLLTAHVVLVTIVGVLFVAAGVGLRSGGFF